MPPTELTPGSAEASTGRAGQCKLPSLPHPASFPFLPQVLILRIILNKYPTHRILSQNLLFESPTCYIQLVPKVGQESRHWDESLELKYLLPSWQFLPLPPDSPRHR